MQPDDPSITPVSIAASATTFNTLLLLFALIGHTFLLVRWPGRVNRRRLANAIAVF